MSRQRISQEDLLPLSQLELAVTATPFCTKGYQKATGKNCLGRAESPGLCRPPARETTALGMGSRHGNLLQALASQSQPEECWPLSLFHVRDLVSCSKVPMGIEFSSAKGTNPNVPFAHRSQIRTIRPRRPPIPSSTSTWTSTASKAGQPLSVIDRSTTLVRPLFRPLTSPQPTLRHGKSRQPKDWPSPGTAFSAGHPQPPFPRRAPTATARRTTTNNTNHTPHQQTTDRC